MHPRFLAAAGGFAWWYLDVISPAGDGLVLIWSYGLPFLPGYADAARAGGAPLPVERPSLNVVVYRGGAPAFYLLQEYDSVAAPGGALPGQGIDVSSRGARLTLGRSTFASWVEDGRRRVEVELDCALPGTSERLTGVVRVDGVARDGDPAATDPDGEPHVWTPLTGPATGEADLRCGGRPLPRVQGRAYHDRNGGSAALHDLGIRHWTWGRLPFEGRERIFYLLWPTDPALPPRALGVEIDAAGRERRVEGLEVVERGERRTLAGLRWAETTRLVDGGRPWMEVRHTVVADSGPFYLRFVSEGRLPDGETTTGWSELCYPDRVDLAVHRPFVRMKVHHAAGGNSPWVPLFTGPRGGRVRRLVRHLLPVGGG